MSTQIKFGTDGWRAIIAKEYTVDNVARVAEATAKWLLKNYNNASVVIGHDCRFGGEMFAETVAGIMCVNNIKVYLAKDFVSTPMISLGTVKKKASLGIIITASHNPPSYNGFKIKGDFGGPAFPAVIEEIEALIPDNAIIKPYNISDLEKIGKLEYIDLEEMYIDHVAANFDLDVINNSNINFAYNAMFGAGQNVIRKLFPEAYLFNCEENPGFNGIAPEPIPRNLEDFKQFLIKKGNIDYALITDGDADRIGIMDGKGNFIDAHHIILLLIHYLHKYKKMTGKVVVAFSTSMKIKKICEAYTISYEVTKIGFKYICEKMVHEDVLVGGEESGGIAVKGHIPERDGIWMGLVLLEFMAKTGKKLHELIQEVYDVVGAFAYDRNDLTLDESLKQSIIANCKSGTYKNFCDYNITNTEDIDGYKYYFDDDVAIMIRASGTEPVLRVYCEGKDPETVKEYLEAAKKTLLGK